MLVRAAAVEIYSPTQAGMGGDQVATVNCQKKMGSSHHNRQLVENMLVLIHRALWLWLINCRIQGMNLTQCNHKKQENTILGLGTEASQE